MCVDRRLWEAMWEKEAGGRAEGVGDACPGGTMAPGNDKRGRIFSTRFWGQARALMSQEANLVVAGEERASREPSEPGGTRGREVAQEEDFKSWRPTRVAFVWENRNDALSWCHCCAQCSSCTALVQLLYLLGHSKFKPAVFRIFLLPASLGFTGISLFLFLFSLRVSLAPFGTGRRIQVTRTGRSGSFHNRIQPLDSRCTGGAEVIEPQFGCIVCSEFLFWVIGLSFGCGEVFAGRGS